jgi:hypothetical protein
MFLFKAKAVSEVDSISRLPLGVLCETRLHDRDSRVTLNTKA